MDFNMEKPSKKRKCKLQEDEQTNGLDSLPTEIALDIFSRLSMTSVIQSRFVCRSWQNLSHDRNLVSMHLSQVAKRDPLLMFHSDFPIRNQLCFAEFSGDDHDAKGVVKKISIPFSASMPEFTVVGSCSGLLCLRDSLFKDAICIYNPFTNYYKDLPKTRQYDDEIVLCGFGYHPETKQYKVVKIVYYLIADIQDSRVRRIRTRRRSKSEVLVLCSGNNKWRNIGQVPYYLERRSQGALFTNGRLHWLTRGVYGNVRGLIIISFDLSDEKFHEVLRPDFSSAADGHNYLLASLKGCLSAVVYKDELQRDLEIWVMKEYNVKESWIKEFKIGGNVPESPSTKLQQPLRIWRNTCIRESARVLCILRNGEILIEYKVGKLALYDVVSGRYKDITFKGMPRIFQTVVHYGSLNQIDLPVNT
ncbi:putative F-box and associated interaction domains-containing protein [Heracleum sosnowskyi]|uniref:F-box and associated interaction domains-containing protein n=1 Tax=Heracleum sosnowskyi TaxID=360622 RepID=A0AAD8GTF5_9APIA|nr:putative F-box and associated interaction domains-containing protein [Heracleum sosnowskyi]